MKYLLSIILFAIPFISFAQVTDNTGADKLAYIKALEQCESHCRTDIKILDTDGKFSYGVLMFHRATFDFYGKKYNLPHNNIYSQEQQELIALYMLNDGLWRQWYNCAKVATAQLGAFPLGVEDV